jgi:hypothetical protein
LTIFQGGPHDLSYARQLRRRVNLTKGVAKPCPIDEMIGELEYRHRGTTIRSIKPRLDDVKFFRIYIKLDSCSINNNKCCRNCGSPHGCSPQGFQ